MTNSTINYSLTLNTLSCCSIPFSFNNFPIIYCLSFFKTSSLIRYLFRLSRPFTIIFRVIFSSINSIKAFIYRFVSHIFKKLYKIIAPLITYFNSFSSIPFIALIFFIITSIFHMTPNAINISSAHAMFCESFFTISIIYFLTFFTSFRMTASKRRPWNQMDISTITFTIPLSPTTFIVRTSFYNKPFIVFVSSKINKIWHKLNKTFKNYSVDNNIYTYKISRG